MRLSNDFYPIVGDKFNLNLRQLKQEHKFVCNMLKYFLKSQLHSKYLLTYAPMFQFSWDRRCKKNVTADSEVVL